MVGIFHKYRNGLQSIQRSDDATKKRWLIGLTASAMLIVVGLWVMYLKVTVPTVTRIENIQSTTTTINLEKKESFAATVASDSFFSK